MSEEPQNSRLDSLIGIFKAFLRIDPMIALIAILIIAPIALPVGSAILNGETEVTITFVVFIAAITLVVYIPLIIVRAYISKEKELTTERKDAINKEIASRVEDKQHARERTDKIVDARIANMEAQTKAIIDNIPNFDRFLLHEEAKNIREALNLDMKDEGGMNSRLGLVIEAFESVNRKFDILEKIVPSLQSTVEEVRNFFLEKDSIMPEAVLKQMEGMATMIQELNDRLLAKESEELVTSAPGKFEQEETTSVKTEADIPEEIKSSLAIHQTVKPNSVISIPPLDRIDSDKLREAMDIVDNMEDSEPLPQDNSNIPISAITQTEADRQTLAPINYWECSYCGNKNPLKAPRCRKCAKGQKIVEEN